MSRFKELAQTVIEENRASLLDMEDSEVQRLVDEIAKAKKVQVFGFTVKLRGQINTGNPSEIPSIQPMAALCEQAVFLFEHIVVMLLMEKLVTTPAKMARCHTNLDGYMSMD